MTIFLAQDPVRCKIIMDNKYLKQLKNFKYLGSEISYENEKYVPRQTSKVCSNTENFKQQLYANSGLKIFKNKSIKSR